MMLICSGWNDTHLLDATIAVMMLVTCILNAYPMFTSARDKTPEIRLE